MGEIRALCYGYRIPPLKSCYWFVKSTCSTSRGRGRKIPGPAPFCIKPCIVTRLGKPLPPKAYRQFEVLSIPDELNEHRGAALGFKVLHLQQPSLKVEQRESSNSKT
jgi:hypothetical protein